jgi:hypothetical protein
MTRQWTCEGCGQTGTQITAGPARKWCSDRCRKQTLYTGTCVDCGGRTGFSGTSVPSERCSGCTREHLRIWTRERVLADMVDWFDLFGEPPSAHDWNQTLCRSRGWTWRVERYEGTRRRWPFSSGVQELFGSWNAAIEAAGFTAMYGGHKRSELKAA